MIMKAIQNPLYVVATCAIAMLSFTICNAQSPGTLPQIPSASNVIRVDQAEIKCMHKIQIAAQSDGLIDALLVEEGSAVKKGDLLLKIDDRMAAAELAVAVKELEAAEAQSKQTAHIDYAEKANAVSKEEYTEIKELFEKTRAASYSEVRKKLLEAQRSEAGVKVAEVDHQKDLSAAAIAAEKVSAAKVQLALRQITSTYDGVIVERLRDEGEWVKAGEPVFRLLHLNEMKVEAMVNLNGKSVAQLQNAPMKVRVRIGGDHPDLLLDARINFVSSQIEVNNTVRVWARIQNRMLGDNWLLRDGMSGSVDILVNEPALAASRLLAN